jgi:hypothetical protein
MDLAQDLERRHHPRLRRRLACKLLVDGRERSGVVRDLSAGGLFVWTRRPMAPRQAVVVAFAAPEGTRFVLEASASRRSQVANSLAATDLPGLGLHIQAPPAHYLSWVARATGVDS